MILFIISLPIDLTGSETWFLIQYFIILNSPFIKPRGLVQDHAALLKIPATLFL